MLRRGRALAVGLLAAVSLLVAGCGSGGTVSTGSNSSAGTPVRGGTLTILGQSDIFNLDTVSAYYTVSTLLERLFTRQLFSYADTASFAGQLKLVPDVATEIPTAANGGITDGGKTLTVHLKQGVDWNTSPARQVTAADFVREFKMLCNPVSPVGAPGYFLSTIVGMQDYCNGFAKVPANVSAISAYVDGHSLPGVVATSDLTLTFHLIQPAADFLNILAMGFCSARPVEYMKYLPDSAQFRQNTLSDGPYEITSYTADKGFTLQRNPAWKQSTDTLRHNYVSKVVITEGLTADSVQQQLEAGTGDMEWDVAPPTQDIPSLLSTHDSNLVIGPSGPAYVDLGTYLAMNQYAGPMKNKLVREAVEYAVNKNAIVQILGGPQITETTNQLILPGNVGYAKGFNPFPDNNGAGDPAKAKSLLTQAGQSGVAVKLLYSTTQPMPRVAQSLQSSLQAAGFKVTLVPATQADFYGKYLEDPTTSKQDTWDIAPPGWVPDWFGNNGRSTVQPLLTDPAPGSNDFGGYNSSAVNALIAKALAAPSTAAASTYWAQADETGVEDAAVVPINVQKWPIYHSSQVKGCIFFANALNCDPTNVWLSGG
ncbi:MAG TPA: ABC transporter substrate-binding protein [Streptosporangiaceae bacterium]|nr:ABC transporter substrate-binding protein [Streptosporangiaceae bacterium]